MEPQVLLYNDWTQKLLIAMEAQNCDVSNMDNEELDCRCFTYFCLLGDSG